MQCGWPADQVEVVGFVDSEGFMDITVRVDICSHGAVKRQTAEGEKAGDFITKFCQKEKRSYESERLNRDSVKRYKTSSDKPKISILKSAATLNQMLSSSLQIHVS